MEDELPVLMEKLRSSDGITRRKAREALVKMEGGVVPYLIPMLASPHDQSRWEAAKALAELRDPSAAPALVQALEDASANVRWQSAEALIEIGEASLVPLLRALIGRADSVWLRETAHKVLREIWDEEEQAAGPERAMLDALARMNPVEVIPHVAYQAIKHLTAAG